MTTPPDYAAFGIGLFRRLADATPGANVVVSPLSAGLALSMFANGATGETGAQVERVLASGAGLDALNQGNLALSRVLRTEDVELAIANSLWARGPFLPLFIQRVTGLYGAEAGLLTSSGSPINEWVSRSTAGRIQKMMPEVIDPLIILLLLNAVYFKGRWQDEFDPAATRDRTFHTPAGPVEWPMMSRTGRYGWLRVPGLQAVRLPYRGGRFAMYVLLPGVGEDLARLRERLAADTWAQWMGRFRAQEVSVVIPRYRMEVTSLLNDALQAMGMADAFVSGRAALDGMLPAKYVAREGPYVSEVRQKVFIEVNEEGTEAAASTVVVVETRGLESQAKTFVADRPFLLAVRDDTTGALLFIGQVNDPVTE